MDTDEDKVMQFHVKNNLPIMMEVPRPKRFTKFFLLFTGHMILLISKILEKLSGGRPRGNRQHYFRSHLLIEEVGETILAIARGNMFELADGIADILYVTHGIGITYGVSSKLAFNEVHRANMTKDFKNNSRRDYKGDWSPPDIDTVVAYSKLYLTKVLEHARIDVKGLYGSPFSLTSDWVGGTSYVDC